MVSRLANHRPEPTTCPFCGTDTGLRRQVDPELGALSLGELVTLVRNEWRQKLGRQAYRRSHSSTLIRALVRFGLEPERPERSQAVEEALWREVAELETWGLNRQEMYSELLHLSESVWELLTWSDPQFSQDPTLVRRIDGKLRETLGWPTLAPNTKRQVVGSGPTRSAH